MAITGNVYWHENMSWNSSSDVSALYPEDYEDEMFQIVFEEFKQRSYTIYEPMTIVLIVLYGSIFITSLIGNVLVLLVIVPNKRMWSVTNNFLVNLAVADLLVTVLCIPMTLAGKIYKPWVFGDVMCKLTPYLQGVSVASSTFTITAMSLDRCLAILYPMKFRNKRTKGNVRILLVLIWITSAALMIPLLVVYKTQEFVKGVNFKDVDLFIICAEYWPSHTQRRSYDFSLLCIICLIPAIIVIVSYVLMGKRLWVTDARLKENDETRSIYRSSEKNNMDCIRANRRRLAKMCIVVSIVFVVCWLPYYTVNIYLDFKNDGDIIKIIYWSLLIGHLHCITNPILYCFMHKPFRFCVKRMLPCWRGSLARCPSGYGTNNFTKNRLVSGVTSIRSRSHRGSNKSSNSSTPTHHACLSPRRSHEVKDTPEEVIDRPHDVRDMLPDDISPQQGPSSDWDSAERSPHKTTLRKVQLILRHLRKDKLAKSDKTQSFQLVVIENPMTTDNPLTNCHVYTK